MTDSRTTSSAVARQVNVKQGATVQSDSWKVVSLLARYVIVCTGGKSLPKSGSDGGGYRLVENLGHTITKPLVPALVPLVLADSHWIRELSGVTVPTTVTLSKPSGKRIVSCSGSTLCTHRGLSGPAVLDISRHWLIARNTDPDVQLSINWLTGPKYRNGR